MQKVDRSLTNKVKQISNTVDIDSNVIDIDSNIIDIDSDAKVELKIKNRCDTIAEKAAADRYCY